MNIGKLIAEALCEAQEEQKNKGPWMPLNDAAKAIHDAHQAYVAENWPKLKQAELEMMKIKNRMDEERQQWVKDLQTAQPEMNPTAKGNGWEINDNNTEFCVYYASEEERNAAQGDAPQPPWAKGITFGGKPN